MSGLSGLRVIVTRPQAQAQRLAELIQEHGGESWIRPLIQIEFSDEKTLMPQFSRLLAADVWIATSANGVRALGRLLQSSGRDAATLPSGFVVGEQTRKAAALSGLRAHVPAGVNTATDLARELVRMFAGQPQRHIICLEGDRSDGQIRHRLREQGHLVERWVMYRTLAAEVHASAWTPCLIGPDADQTALVFYSPSAVFALSAACHAALLRPPRRALCVCVGETTAGWCNANDISVDAVASRPADDAVCAALISVWQDRQQRQR